MSAGFTAKVELGVTVGQDIAPALAAELQQMVEAPDLGGRGVVGDVV